MLPIMALVLSTSLTGAPSAAHTTTLPAATRGISTELNKNDRVQATRLEAFILKKQHHNKKRRAEVRGYARRLAERIVVEARRNRIPVAVFAAIAWNESWYWWKTKGTSHEFGVWQIWPYGSAVSQEWDVLRKAGRIGTFPNKRWKSLGYKLRRQVLQDVTVSTALAARILRRLVRWCKAKHKVHKEKLLGSRRHHRWMDRYAHYNSGTAWPKPVYFYQLRRHTRTLQRVLHR